MAHSRPSPALACWLALGATALSSAALAAGAPRSLLPPASPEVAAEAPAESTIRSEPLPPPEPVAPPAQVPSSVPAGNRGLWAGTDAGLAEGLLRHVPQPPGPYPILQRLTRTLLKAPLPGATKPEADPLGQLTEALAAGDDRAACALPVTGLPQPLLTEQRIHCRLVDGDGAGAALMLDAAEEAGQVPDPLFGALVEAMSGGDPAAIADPPAAPDPVVLALLAKAPASIETDVLGKAAPAVQAALARNPSLPIEQRVQAVESAALAGLASAAAVRAVYADAPAGAGDLTAAIDGGMDAMLRARVVQALAAEPMALPRAALLQKAFRAAPAGPARVVFAAALAPEAVRLPRERTLDWAADAVVPLLLMAGETASAKGWMALVMDAQKPTSAERATVQALLPYRAILGQADPAGLVALATAAGGEPLLALADGLGRPVPTAVWLQALEASDTPEGAVPPLAVWRGLDEAVAGEHQGAALAWLLAGLGGAPEAVTPAFLAEALHGLIRLDRMDDALALAASTAVAEGA